MSNVQAFKVDKSLMKRTLIVLIVLVSSFAQASVDLLIEHPRNPSKLKDRYTVNCDKKCALEIQALNPLKGNGDHKVETKVKELWSIQLPKDDNIRGRVLYTITAVDGDKKISLKVGYPDNYDGDELSKYLGLISYIEDVKKTMRSQLEAGKK